MAPDNQISRASLSSSIASSSSSASTVLTPAVCTPHGGVSGQPAISSSASVPPTSPPPTWIGGEGRSRTRSLPQSSEGGPTVPSSPASLLANSAGVGRYGSSEGDDVDDDDSHSQSTIGGGGGVSDDRYPESVSSSVREHIYEGGMRYHAYRDGRYPFPNDEIEQGRDDMKHNISCLLLRGEYFVSPIKAKLEEGARVLDLGTGTGIWCMEMADRYTKSNFTGLDLSPIQPNYVPENLDFYVDDIELEWLNDPAEKLKYDFIYMRNVIHTVRDRSHLFEGILQQLKPGGYFEVVAFDNFMHCDDDSVPPEKPNAFRDWLTYLDAGMRAVGSCLRAIGLAADEMRDAGFDDVTVVAKKSPIGPWAGDRRLRTSGEFSRTVLVDGLRGLSRRPLCAGLGWTDLQLHMFLVDVRRALLDDANHIYFKLYTVYGRRPLEGEGAAGKEGQPERG